MTAPVFAIVLLAAVLHALWNAIVKHGGDPFLRLAVIALTGSALMVPVVPFVPVPDPASWPWLLGSMVTHIFYYTLLCLGYLKGDLSLVYPVARGVAPPTVALLAATFAAELPSPAGLAALAMISVGILAIARTGTRVKAQHGSMLFAAGCGMTIAVYTLFDGLGIRAAGTELGYIAWLFLIDGLPFGLVVLWLQRHKLRAFLANGLWPTVVGGVMSFLAYALVIWAMNRAPMAFVSALRETSVVLAAILGTKLLGEPFGRERIGAAAIVALGTVLLKLAG